MIFGDLRVEKALDALRIALIWMPAEFTERVTNDKACVVAGDLSELLRDVREALGLPREWPYEQHDKELSERGEQPYKHGTTLGIKDYRAFPWHWKDGVCPPVEIVNFDGTVTVIET